MKYLTKRKGKPRGRGRVRKTIKRGGGDETKTFSDGTYVGNIANDLPEGVGKMTYENGDIYDGKWRQGKKDGNGKMTYKNVGVFESVWRNDLASDYGTMIYANGDKYTGYIINGKKTNGLHGFSTMKYANGDVYFGNWKNDMKEGDGTMTYNNKDKYTGNWVNDMREGVGKMTYQSGEIYEGNWHEDTRSNSGKAKIKYPNGDQYKGDLVDDLKQGNGEMYYVNGDDYTGGWIEDKKSGSGKMKYANGNAYEGDWVNDLRQGHGFAYDYDTDTTYEGTWNNDAPTAPFRPQAVIDPYQIHKFTANIDFQELNAFLKDHASKDQDLPPLYHDQPQVGEFANYIDVSMKTIIKNVDAGKIEKRLEDLKSVMENALNNLNYQEFTSKLLTGVFLSLKYAQLQTPAFKEAYLDSYLDDTCMAHGDYKSVQTLSCAGGSIERFVTSLSPAATTALTTDEVSEEQKDEYKKLIEMISRNPQGQVPLLAVEWFKLHPDGKGLENMDTEQRKANLKAYIKETVTNDTPEVDTFINDYMENFDYENDAFTYKGGRRTRKRIRKRRIKKTKKRKKKARN